MRIPRDLSGQALIRHLSRAWGYRVVNRAGSHVTLETREPGKHRVVVPDHPTLRVGTLNQILRAVADHKGVTRSDLLSPLLQTEPAVLLPPTSRFD